MLVVLVVLFLSACGTLEIRLEQPDSPRTASTPVVGALATEPVSGPALEITPTPTPADFDPWLPEVVSTPALVGEYPAPAGLFVAYVQDGQIWLWKSGQAGAVPLTSLGDDYHDLRFSDDGEILAFRRGDDLWVVGSDGNNQHLLVGAEDFVALGPAGQETVLHRFEWIPGTHRLAYNTRQRMPMGLALTHDLYLVDADTQEQVPLLPPGQGGEFYFSPDGRQIALVTPGKISLVDADGGNLRDGVLIHTPVVTYSEAQYYAQPVWALDSSALTVAIPPADPTARQMQLVSIWHIPTGGEPARLETSIETVPLLGHDAIKFSPDLEFVSYAQMKEEGAGPEYQGEIWLELRRLANQDVQAYPDVYGQYGWAPDSRRLAFEAGRQAPQLRIGQWSGPTVAGSVDAGVSVSDLRWVDAERYLLLTWHGTQEGSEGDSWNLVLGDVGGSSTILASTEDHIPYAFVVTGAPDQVPAPTPATTVTATPRQEPVPTQTPIAPLSGLVYRRGEGLWTDTGWERVQLSDRANALLSANGDQALYLNEDDEGDVDLWLADWITGARRNLTQTFDRMEDLPRWWPARPEVILFSSAPEGSPMGIGASGFLSAVGPDGSNYRVLDDQHPVGGPPAPSPDGQTIAYGRGITGWLYHWQTGPVAFDPADYGLPGTGEIEISNPAWSPDGTKLAWVLSGDLAAAQTHRWGIGVFDLEKRTAHLLHHYQPASGDGWPPAPSWSRDGVWLAFDAWAGPPDQGGIWVARVEGLGSVGGESHHLADGHPAGWSPAWSPDGQWLAFSGTSVEEPGHWLTQVGSWHLLALDLPPTAQVVDWINWRP
jgi:hypothetical protein